MRLATIIVMAVLLQACAVTPVDKGEKLRALRTQADMFYQRGDYQKSAVLYAEVVKRWPEEADNWFRLGNCYAQLKQPAPAVQSYREVLVRQPDHSKAWYNMIYLQAAALGESVVDMYQHVDPNDPQFAHLRELVEAVIAPFGQQVKMDAGQRGETGAAAKPVQDSAPQAATETMDDAGPVEAAPVAATDQAAR